MRGTVAKRIRREVYGDQSIWQRRRYGKEIVEKVVKRFDEKAKEFKAMKVNRGIIKNIGLRAEYQDAKRDYMRGER